MPTGFYSERFVYSFFFLHKWSGQKMSWRRVGKRIITLPQNAQKCENHKIAPQKRIGEFLK